MRVRVLFLTELAQLRNGRGHGRTVRFIARGGWGTGGALAGGRFGHDRAD
jgi:hypothetical protein